jgi:hypothetical protein
MSTIPVYRFRANDPAPAYTRYRCSTLDTPPAGWTLDRIAFYAFSDGSVPGTVQIYEHQATDAAGRVRYYYDAAPNNDYGWGQGTPVFFAYPNDSPVAGARPVYAYYNIPPGLGGWNYAFSANPNISNANSWVRSGQVFAAPSDITINVMAVRNATPPGGWTTSFQPSGVTMPYAGRLVFKPASTGWAFPANSFRIVSSDNPHGNSDFAPQQVVDGVLYVGDSETDAGLYSYCLTLVDSSSGQPFDADPEVRNTDPDDL